MTALRASAGVPLSDSSDKAVELLRVAALQICQVGIVRISLEDWAALDKEEKAALLYAGRLHSKSEAIDSGMASWSPHAAAALWAEYDESEWLESVLLDDFERGLRERWQKKSDSRSRSISKRQSGIFGRLKKRLGAPGPQ